MNDTLAEIIAAQTNASFSYHVVKFITWHGPTRRVGRPAHAWVADNGVAQRLIQHLNVRSFPNFARLSPHLPLFKNNSFRDAEFGLD